MKRLFLLLLVAAAIPSFAQHQRRVLMEEFSNASCGPCAAQNPGFHALQEANEPWISPVKYQTNWPGFDPMNVQTQAQVQPRVDYYAISGVPDGFANGNIPMTNYDGGQGLNFFTSAKIQAAYNTLTPVAIAVSHQLTANYDSILIEVAVTSDDSLAGAGLYLRVAVTEAHIHFDGPPGSNGETDFYNVMRKMLPTHTGTATGDFAAGETKTYSLAWALKDIYDLNQLEVVAWVQNDVTKEVWQSERSLPLNNVPVAGIDFLTTSEQLTTTLCGDTYTPSYEFTNTGDSALTSAFFMYRLDNLAWDTLEWTGNLATGEIATLTFPDISFPAGGTHSYSVRVLYSNNGIQTNMVTPDIDAKILAFTTVVATPLAQGFQTGTIPPTGWGTVNVTNGWEIKIGAGAGSTRSGMINFYDLPSGTVDLITPRIDLSTVENTALTFDYAYTYYVSGATTFVDTFQIDVSSDCAETWETVFYLGGADLATAPPTSASYSPTAAHWVHQNLDLSNYDGSAEILVRFRGISGYGNNFFIDNIDISQLVGTKDLLQLGTFTLSPNPASSASELAFSLENPESIQLAVYDALGIRVHSEDLGNLAAGRHTAQISAASLPAGSYRVVLQSRQGLAQTQWMVVK